MIICKYYIYDCIWYDADIVQYQYIYSFSCHSSRGQYRATRMGWVRLLHNKQSFPRDAHFREGFKVGSFWVFSYFSVLRNNLVNKLRCFLLRTREVSDERRRARGDVVFCWGRSEKRLKIDWSLTGSRGLRLGGSSPARTSDWSSEVRVNFFSFFLRKIRPTRRSIGRGDVEVNCVNSSGMPLPSIYPSRANFSEKFLKFHSRWRWRFSQAKESHYSFRKNILQYLTMYFWKVLKSFRKFPKFPLLTK